MDESTTKDVFLKVFDEYADSIFRFCLVKTTDREVAEDLTQETFARLWQRLRDGRDVSELRGFLYAIARNLVIDWYRKKKPESLDGLRESGFEPADRNLPSAEEDASYEEVLRTIRQLDQDDREVLTLRFVEGLEPKEIAEMFGVSANVVSVRIHRAIEKARSLLHHDH